MISTIVHTGKADAVTITADFDLDGAESWIITDKHWLLENLLCYMSNAVKFVAEGSIVINASVEFDDDKDDDDSDKNDNDEDAGAISLQTLGSFRNPHSMGNNCMLQKQSRTTAKAIKFIRFSVTDTGIGIPKENMESLFQPFYQAQTCAGGTGLGLYALSKRVEAMGGRYGVSERTDGGQGCSFWFSIPYRPDTEMRDVVPFDQEMTVPAGARDLLTAAPHLIHRERVEEECEKEKVAADDGDNSDSILDHKLPLPRVLLVDDSNMIQKTTTRALQREGFRVSSAYNGVECLQLLKEAKESGDLYAVVLMDLQMPVMDGLETVKRMREEERRVRGVVKKSDTERECWVEGSNVLPFPTEYGVCNSERQYVIGVSANSDSDSIDIAAAAGMDNFIAKPLKVQNMRKVCASQIPLSL